MAGRVGRPSLPANVHLLHGNPSKKQAGALLDEFSPDVHLASCPKHMRGEAAAEYQRLGAELERYGLVSDLDRGMLAMIATLWARHVWAEKKIEEHNRADKSGHEAGMVHVSANGYRGMSVYLQISNAAMSQYQRLASEFGLSPASRSRVKAGAGPQLELPGIEPLNPGAAPTLRSFVA